MSDYGPQDTSTTSLGVNQFPISEAWTPNVGFAAVEGGPQTTDSGGKKSTPVAVYAKDGGNVVEGVTTDAAVTGDNAGTLSAKLRGLSKMFASVWNSVTNSLAVTISPSNTGLPVNLPLIVQKTNNVSSGSVASLAKAFTSNNAAGNSIVVVCAVGNGTAPTISDTLSNVYTQAAQIANGTALNTAVFYSVGPAGGGGITAGVNTVTVNNGGTTASIAMEIYEVSGFITQVQAQPDQTASATGTSGTAATAVIGALFPNELAFTGVGVGTAAQTITAGAGWTNDSGQQNPTTPAGLFSFVSLSQFLATQKSITPQATFTSEPWAIATASFKPVAVSMTGPVILYGSNNSPGDVAVKVNGTGSVATTANMQINNTIVAAGNGVTNAQTLRVTLSSDSTGIVNPGNTQNTTPWLVSQGPPADLILLASAAQTLTQTLADQTNFAGKGIRVVLDMTVVGTGSVTLEIDAKDVASGKYVALLTGAAVTTNSTNVYVIHPELTAAANSIAKDVLPHTWRIKVTANNANSATYSVGASYLT